jgi:hypothetical protein
LSGYNSRMEPTVGGSLAWALWYAGELAFKWVPGAVVSLTGTAPAGAGVTAPTEVAAPVSAPQVVQYLQTASAPGVYDSLFHFWSTFVAFSVLFTLGMSAIIIYCSIRMFQIRQTERRRFAALQHTVTAHDVPKTQLRWDRILQEAGSGNERNWRLAILEADIMLNELLDAQGYKGETMAEKMRAADRAAFQSLDLAWEAHKFRNRIAHESNPQLLNPREVRRVIGLYERVFKEFHFI